LEQVELIRNIVEGLENLSLPYCFTGSIVSNFYGLPRLTHDLDIIVLMEIGDIDRICNEFSKNYYIDREAVEEAVKNKSLFNVIHPQSSLKVDFWVRKEKPFDVELFNRRTRREIIEGIQAYIASPEDIIISKLVWARETDSERQLIDAKGVYEVQKESLDMGYLKTWAKKLHLLGKLEQLTKGPLPNTS